jgi:hypothetical protein
MGRQRVPKGQIIQKKDEKIGAVIQALPDGYSEQDFVQQFREMYPREWNNVVARYEAHERLTKPGKAHPMAPPEKYMKNALKAHLLRQTHASKSAGLESPIGEGSDE